MARVKIMLYTPKELKDEKHPIALRITADSKRKYIFLGYACTEKEWDEENCRFRKNFPNSSQLNIILNKKESLAKEICFEFDRLEKSFSFSEFEREFLGSQHSKTTVLQYIDQWIDRLNSTGKIGNANVYADTKRVMTNYTSLNKLKFSDINFRFLKKFEEHLASSGHSGNSISVYLRTLRALFNKAIREGIVDEKFYPFKTYKISEIEEETRPRAISKEDMIKLVNQIPKQTNTDINAKNYFLFSFYNMGMNFTDIALLKWKDISNNRVNYTRSKTGKFYSINILPQTAEILEYYKKQTSESVYVFPILNKTHDTPLKINSRIKTILKKTNNSLKALASDADVSANITSYVARHSWGTIAKRNGISTSIISEGYQHDSERTTQIYLDKFENSVLDEAFKNLLS